MESIYQQTFLIDNHAVDRYGRLKLSMLLSYAQEVASRHITALSMNYETLADQGMFWAVVRHRVQITRLPHRDERIRVETWPMPSTRTAFPRSVVAYDEDGNEVFRTIALWVLMDIRTRAMILPGKSGLIVPGTLRGNELAAPSSLSPRVLQQHAARTVRFTDLDRNGHMNNTRCMDWIDDLLPSTFHETHTAKELTVCYLAEAREGQNLDLHWDLLEEGGLQVDAHRQEEDRDARVFSARILY